MTNFTDAPDPASVTATAQSDTETTISSRGPIEGIKTAVMTALRNALVPENPEVYLQNLKVNMEYPATLQDYPCIWVQFSLTKNQIMGIGHVEYENGIPYKEWSFRGNVSLQIFALTSVERDRIADAVINMYAFSSASNANLFFKTLATNAYINMSPDQDALNPLGQSTNIGTPWSEDEIVYVDAYSFQMLGDYRTNYETGEMVLLTGFDYQFYSEALGQTPPDSSEAINWFIAPPVTDLPNVS